MAGCRVGPMLVLQLVVLATLGIVSAIPGSVDWDNHGFVHPLPIAYPSSDNPGCREDSLRLEAALWNRTLWAEQMWDASAKTAVGLVTGTTIQMGDFDECLGVRAPVEAQYCLVTLDLEVPKGHDTLDPETEEYPPQGSAWDKIYYGGSKAKQRLDRLKVALCVPSSCTPDDLRVSLTRYIQGTNQSVASVAVEEGACSRGDDPGYMFTSGDIAFCVVMLSVFIVVTSATVYDLVVYEYDGHSPPANYVQCLSAYRGLRSLLRRDQGVAELDLSTLYGVHSFAFLFIVLGHRFGSYMCAPITNYEDVEYMFRHYLLSMWTGHMDLFCDVFFFLSAFLLGVILSLQLDKSYISPFKVYLHRLVRLVPAYATVIFFYATVYYKIGSGPLWNAVVRREKDQCSQYWWVNLLFLNNYLGGDKMCLLQSWYIACDFQLFVGGTLLLLLLNRRPLLGLPLSAVLLAVGLAAPFLGTYLYNRPALLTFYKGMWEQVRTDDVYLSVYSQAHYRAPGYLIGVLAGYAVFRRRTTELTKSNSWLLLGCGFMVCFVTYWTGAIYTDPARPYNALESALYAALNHAVFALGMTSVFWAFIFGPKSWVSDLFSWRGFVPLSKLSYSMYLVHNIPQIAAAAAARAPLRFDIYGLVSWTISDLALGLLMSLVMFLYIETPCRYVFKHLTAGKTQHLSVKTAEDVKDVKEVSDWSYRLTNP
ncbi:nose resistant to fluoxetine protein 6-like [Macrosteles quadrilineatus]|uniref:nose resistant to fluoxetine protein 6-like n=1 Tax=Macrosteles quadrilineatus TaxID=74068 RepID=UPI0023E2A648|nr:nose resistant to fluoxetine protein 6-like [Macrosteles quadrilineatus]XP_054263047.1 nose resistant to fluoxetine protein 6-like [Macrosteles quadrilineatus]